MLKYGEIEYQAFKSGDWTYLEEKVDKIQNPATFCTFFVRLLFEVGHFPVGWPDDFRYVSKDSANLWNP